MCAAELKKVSVPRCRNSVIAHVVSPIKLAHDENYPMKRHQSSKSNSSGTMLALAVAGVTGNSAEAALVNPPLFVAVKEQLYAIPAVNPTTVNGDAVPVAVRVICPFALQVAV
jgi:hypothetical protein